MPLHRSRNATPGFGVKVRGVACLMVQAYSACNGAYADKSRARGERTHGATDSLGFRFSVQVHPFGLISSLPISEKHGSTDKAN